MSIVDENPNYTDDSIVKKETQKHILAGRSVLQIFQFSANEEQHSIQLLNLLRAPLNASVLSLGSGVAGMERYWKQWVPSLNFTFVNISQSQLDLSLCDGHRFCADIETFKSAELFDVVVIAYVIGHVDWEKTLSNALAHTKDGGLIVLYDVFDANDAFSTTFHYTPPKCKDIEGWAVGNKLAFQTVLQGGISPIKVIENSFPWVTTAVTPALFVLRK